MGWKIFAGLNVLPVLWTLFGLATHGGQTTVGGLIGLAISALTAAGLCGYAFRQPSLSPLFWRIFATATILWWGRVLLQLPHGLQGRVSSDPAVLAGVGLAIAAFIGFGLTACLGLWLYAEWLAREKRGLAA